MTAISPIVLDSTSWVAVFSFSFSSAVKNFSDLGCVLITSLLKPLLRRRNPLRRRSRPRLPRQSHSLPSRNHHPPPARRKNRRRDDADCHPFGSFPKKRGLAKRSL